MAASVGLLVAMAGCGDPAVEDNEPQDPQPPLNEDAEEGPANGDGAPDTAASGSFQDPEGQTLGTVELIEAGEGAVEIRVRVEGLDPGFLGLHVHEIGACEPDSTDPEDPAESGDFLSAGAHLNPDDTDHPDHAGDLPSLLVMDNGEATLAATTDRFTIDDLLDEDGTAFMVHSEADNFAHIPDRYDEPDQDTLDTGDAGDRLACAVIE